MEHFKVYSNGLFQFPKSDDGCWETELTLPTGPVRIDINTSGTEMAEPLLNRIRDFLVNVEAFDKAARTAIMADFAGGNGNDSASRLYLSHHLAQFSPAERVQYFGTGRTGSIGIEHLLVSLRLRRMGLYPESDDRPAVLDYTIGEGATQYVLAAVFNAEGEFLNLSMES